VRAPGDVKRRFALRRDVCPPIPGRYANRLRQFIYAKRCPARIAAGDDERTRHAGCRPLDDGDDKALPGAAQMGRIQLAGLYQLVDQGAAAQCPDQHNRSCGLEFAGYKRSRGRRGPWSGRHHTRDVGCEVARGQFNHFCIRRGIHDYRCAPAVGQQEVATAPMRTDPLRWRCRRAAHPDGSAGQQHARQLI
jgi:hypothetical protein